MVETSLLRGPWKECHGVNVRTNPSPHFGPVPSGAVNTYHLCWYLFIQRVVGTPLIKKLIHKPDQCTHITHLSMSDELVSLMRSHFPPLFLSTLSGAFIIHRIRASDFIITIDVSNQILTHFEPPPMEHPRSHVFQVITTTLRSESDSVELFFSFLGDLLWPLRAIETWSNYTKRPALLNSIHCGVVVRSMLWIYLLPLDCSGAGRRAFVLSFKTTQEKVKNKKLFLLSRWVCRVESHRFGRR